MITGRINALVDIANEEKDNATHQFLMWFISEQVEEEETASRVVERLKLMGDAPGGLFIMDQELASRAATEPA
jgi:ferritin